MMSESSTLPLKVAETGPIFVLTTAAKPLSPALSSDSQPGIQALSTSGSLSNAQTFGLLAGSVASPVIVMAIDVSFLRGPNRSSVTLLPGRVGIRARRISTFSHRAQDVVVLSPIDDGIGLVTGSLLLTGHSGTALHSAKCSFGYYASAAIVGRLGDARRGACGKTASIVGLPSSRTAARLWNASARFRHGRMGPSARSRVTTGRPNEWHVSCESWRKQEGRLAHG